MQALAWAMDRGALADALLTGPQFCATYMAPLTPRHGALWGARAVPPGRSHASHWQGTIEEHHPTTPSAHVAARRPARWLQEGAAG